MTNAPYDPTLTQWLQNSAEYLGLKPKAERIEWLVFLLKETESSVSKPDYDGLLSDLQKKLAARIAQGRW